MDTGRWVDYRYGETLVLTPISILISSLPLARKAEYRHRNGVRGNLQAQGRDGPPDVYRDLHGGGLLLELRGAGGRRRHVAPGDGVPLVLPAVRGRRGFDPIRKSIYFTLLPTALAFEGNVAIAVGGFVKLLIIIVFFLALARRLGWIEEPSVV